LKSSPSAPPLKACRRPGRTPRLHLYRRQT
jgi:hypothetical protein